jgi:hypothetical protein
MSTVSYRRVPAAMIAALLCAGAALAGSPPGQGGGRHPTVQSRQRGAQGHRRARQDHRHRRPAGHDQQRRRTPRCSRTGEPDPEIRGEFLRGAAAAINGMLGYLDRGGPAIRQARRTFNTRTAQI